MRISIGFKLMALAGIGSAMLAYAGLYGTWSSWHATDSLHTKLDESNLEQHDLLAIQAEFLMETHAWDSLLKSIDETSLKTSWDIYDAQFNKVSASVNEALKHTSCNEARVHLASFADQHAKNRELYKKAAETFRLNSFDATPADALVDLIERKPLQILANAMSDSTQEITRYSHDIADSSRTHVYWSVGLLIAVFLLEGIVFIALVRHFLSKPTAKVLNSLKKLEAGDFTGTIEKHYDDELGEIAESTYQVSQHLGQLIVNVQRAAHRLAETAQRVAMVSSMTSEGVKNQREETDSASRSMKEMSDSMQLSVERADEAVATASSVSQQVVVVNGVLNETVRAVQALADEVKNTAAAIQTLKNETQNIGDVAKTIRSIADQTNLLALNAAIEAARAGEQGRGFAVVADEVRKLAQITQNATSDIEQRIDTLQAGASNAMSAMMEGCERADKSVEQATAARKVLESITQAAASIREINEHIVEILGDQKIVANTITGTILNISQVAEQTAHSSRQTSEEVVNVAVEAVRLDEMVEAFILPAGEELKSSGTALTRPATKDDSVELF